jgi:uncharacterized protein YdbL (DUF1318 family)
MKRVASVLLAVVLGCVCWAQADAKEEAKERRKARRAEVEQLVQSGQAEEGADGYLVAKAGLEAAKAALVKAENADRRTGYEAIAKANNKSAEEIGKKAAEIHRARKK